MIVLLIIGITLAMVSVTFRHHRNPQNQAHLMQLENKIQTLRQQGELESKTFGLEITTTSAQFYEYDRSWQAIDSPFAFTSPPILTINHTKQMLPKIETQQPQIIFSPNGSLTSFMLQLSPSSTLTDEMIRHE